MASLINFMGALAPKPLVPSAQYEGVEYRWKFIVFRPALFRMDLLFLVLAILYFGSYFVGASANKRKAHSWFNALEPVLKAQFSKPMGKSEIIADGNSDFFNFSTGRRAIKSLHTTLRLLPQHDFFQTLFHFGWSQYDLKYVPKDLALMEFHLDEAASAQFPDFVWAVVSKDLLSTIKEDRWDLTFTKTTESSALPPQLSVMSEIADVTENLLKTGGSFSLPQLLNNPAVLPYFRSLSISDQPYSRPAGSINSPTRGKYVVLSLAVPPVSATAPVIQFIQGVFQFVDALAGAGGHKPLLAGLRPETRTKLRKRRDELDAELRADAEREAKEAEQEAREDAKAAKRKAEQERIAGLSAAEQQKALERERKKALRKSQGKVMRK